MDCSLCKNNASVPNPLKPDSYICRECLSFILETSILTQLSTEQWGKLRRRIEELLRKSPHTLKTVAVQLACQQSIKYEDLIGEEGGK